MATKGDKPAAKIKRVRRPAKKAVLSETDEPLDDMDVGDDDARTPAPTVTASAGIGAPVLHRFSRVRRRDVTIFLRQLIMLLEAGTPLLKSLRTLSVRLESAGLRSMVRDIAEYVENGNALWQAFERQPHAYFDTVFVNLVKASEASGTLVDVLRRQTDYYERRDMLTRRVRTALVYPVILVVMCGAVLFLMAKFVIPAFKEIFIEALDMQLPWETTVLIGAIDFLTSFKMLVVIGALIVLYVLYRFWRRDPRNRLLADRIKIRVPVIGRVVQKYAIAQMTSSLAMLLKSGMSMMVTLDLVRNAIHNQAVAHSLNAIRDSVEQGGGLEGPLRAASGVIPPVVADMLVTGEESGQLDQIAAHIADTYEEEVKMDIDMLTDLLPPILVVGLGIVVLLLVLGFFMPLIDALGAMSGGA